MTKNDKTLRTVMASALTTAGLSVSAASFGAELPRGYDIKASAAECEIGPFSRTTKAPEYDKLCKVMQDAEKCLAFIKGHFTSSVDGKTRPVGGDVSANKMRYCLDVLEHEFLRAPSDEDI